MAQEKILFVSVVSLLVINLAVAPLVDEGQSFNMPSLEPPEQAVISPDFQPPQIDFESDGGILDDLASVVVIIANSIATFVSWIVGLLITVAWLMWILGDILFSGAYAHPLLTLNNFILGLTALVAIININFT